MKVKCDPIYECEICHTCSLNRNAILTCEASHFDIREREEYEHFLDLLYKAESSNCSLIFADVNEWKQKFYEIRDELLKLVEKYPKLKDHYKIKSFYNKGYCVWYYDYETGKPRVAGRYRTEEEKDKKLEEISSPDSGWLPEEIATISVENDYNFMLPY